MKDLPSEIAVFGLPFWRFRILPHAFFADLPCVSSTFLPVGLTPIRGTFQVSFSALVGSSWGHLGPSWGLLGAILGHLGAILGHLGAILGPSLGHLGAISVVLEAMLASAWAAEALKNVESAKEVSQKREDGDVNSMFKLT